MNRLVKRISILTLAVLTSVSVLGGCARPKAGQRASSGFETSSPSPTSSGAQSYTVQINPDMPTYTCVFSLYGEDAPTARIDILDEDGAVIQTILHADYEALTRQALYFEDITFSGSLSLLLPTGRSAQGLSFDAYVWDGGKNTFEKIPSFSDILNFVVDTDNRRILSRRSGSMCTSYVMYAYQNNRFIQTNSLGWTPADMEVEPHIENADAFVHCTETEGDKITRDFYVPSENGYDLEKRDPQMKRYYEAGSFWDLDSEKWNCPFYDDMLF